VRLSFVFGGLITLATLSSNSCFLHSCPRAQRISTVASLFFPDGLIDHLSTNHHLRHPSIMQIRCGICKIALLIARITHKITHLNRLLRAMSSSTSMLSMNKTFHLSCIVSFSQLLFTTADSHQEHLTFDRDTQMMGNVHFKLLLPGNQHRLSSMTAV
jgi:hypothetical protein